LIHQLTFERTDVVPPLPWHYKISIRITLCMDYNSTHQQYSLEQAAKHTLTMNNNAHTIGTDITT